MPQPETADPSSARESQQAAEADDVLKRLREENEALRYAALSFGDLAERLNDALRQERERRRATDLRDNADKPLD